MAYTKPRKSLNNMVTKKYYTQQGKEVKIGYPITYFYTITFPSATTSSTCYGNTTFTQELADEFVKKELIKCEEIDESKEWTINDCLRVLSKEKNIPYDEMVELYKNLVVINPISALSMILKILSNEFNKIHKSTNSTKYIISTYDGSIVAMTMVNFNSQAYFNDRKDAVKAKEICKDIISKL